MWDTWLNQSTVPALEQAAAFAQKRHMLLAGNIANLDTPDYKTRDLSVDDFQTALREAIDSQQTSGTGRTESRYRASDQTAIERVRDVRKQILYHDGSDVSLEEQITEISKNQAFHNTAIALMRSQFSSLRVAIRESVVV